jgi:hypothetical protein
MNIFVAFFVLLLLLADSTPPAASSIPLIGRLCILWLGDGSDDVIWRHSRTLHALLDNHTATMGSRLSLSRVLVYKCCYCWDAGLSLEISFPTPTCDIPFDPMFLRTWHLFIFYCYISLSRLYSVRSIGRLNSDPGSADDLPDGTGTSTQQTFFNILTLLLPKAALLRLALIN